jgi:hypothetical protein
VIQCSTRAVTVYAGMIMALLIMPSDFTDDTHPRGETPRLRSDAAPVFQ